MMNWKGCGRVRSRPSFSVLFHHLPGGTEKSHEALQDSQSPGRDLNPGPPNTKWKC
jgi:hypothetical protein